MAVRTGVATNAPEVGRFMLRLFGDQVPFATSRAINGVALEFQERQRSHMFTLFTVRNQTFMKRAVKIKPFARKTRLWADVMVAPPGGQARADILTKFESETLKEPRGRLLAVPLEAERTGTGALKGARGAKGPIGRFDFQPHGDSGRVLRGRQGTFMIFPPGTQGAGAVFQRRGGEVKVLFLLTPRGVPITPDLGFVERARSTVDNRFTHHFQREFDHAIRTAR